MGQVVEFPYANISNPLVKGQGQEDHDDPDWDYVLYHCEEVIVDTVDQLDEMGYDAKDEKLMQDIGVVANLLYAAMNRYVKRENLMIPLLDELHEDFEAIRKELDDTN